MPQDLNPPFLDWKTDLVSGSEYPATFGPGGNAGVADATNANRRYPTWMQVYGAGTVVVVNEDDSSSSLVFSGGEVLSGTFKEITSSGVERLRVGVGEPPAPCAAAFAADLYADALSAYGFIDLPPTAFCLATGAPLAVFANGASAVPGLSLTDSKTLCIRWNDNATLNAVATKFAVPPDADIAQPFVGHILASKTGATLADAVTFDIDAFNQVVGALHDADTDYGATSSAMTGNATAKTVQEVTFTLAAADLAAYPASVTLTIKPTNGTLGTDDLCMGSVRILYTKKLTS